MTWQLFQMRLDGLDAGAVEAIFSEHGALSVTLTDAADEPVLEPAPGEAPLWQNTRITGLFAEDTDFDVLADAIVDAFDLEQLPPHGVESLEDRDWEREWLKDFGPMRFGERLWICPGDSSPGDDGAVVVRLDPGLAFGTGTHATTALCLEWLDGLDLAGRTVLDYGCGSGILAIAALRLGARRATAMDIDPQAVTATLENAARNAISADRLTVVGSDAEIRGKFDVVLANILAGPLARLAESLTTRLSSAGKLALSGILSNQLDEVRRPYVGLIGFEKPAYRDQGGQTWVRLSGQRRVS